MDYNHIDDNYKYDVLAQAIYSRQVEHFHYQMDKTNFEAMLPNMAEGPVKEHYKQCLADTITHMTTVDHLHDALVAQIDDQEKYAAAVARLQAKNTDN